MQRILVVDDDRLVADTISIIFRKNGFEVKTAYSADEALGAAREFVPDLMLCDIDMPERDGLEMMADVTEELPECRMLVLTGFYAALNRIRSESSKFPKPVAILTKPCQPAELLREAGTLLQAS